MVTIGQNVNSIKWLLRVKIYPAFNDYYLWKYNQHLIITMGENITSIKWLLLAKI
jgi:hypothetical protein